MSIVSAPDFTRERLRRLANVVQESQAAGASVQATVDAIEKTEPAVAAYLRGALSPQAFPGWIVLLLLILQLALGGETLDDPPNQTQRQPPGLVSPPPQERSQQPEDRARRDQPAKPKKKKAKAPKTFGQAKKKRGRR
ncbi:MAG TPA: hypothetical protein VEX39_11640 [Thermoleophilaceae bacterium]|nr:hypothetical protein [Thermoleophilaceae bacterium]